MLRTAQMGLVGLGLGLCLGGCTLLSDFDVRACSADADCEASTGPVRRCEKSRCVAGCSNNRSCSSADPRSPICSDLGGECQALTSPGGECYVSSGYHDESMGALTAQDMLFIGAFAPTLESPTWLALQLATSEIDAAGGMPTSTAARQPLLVVLCDDAMGAIEGAMQHFQALGARSVVASLEADVLATALSLPSTRGDALLLTPGNPGLGLSEGSPRLWSLGAPVDGLVSAYPAVLRQMVDGAVARSVARDRVRLAVLLGPAPDDEALANAVAARIELDGKLSDDLRREDRLRLFPVPDGPAEERAEVLASVATYAPDVVLVFLGGLLPSPSLEERSGAVRTLAQLAEASGWQPSYLFGPRNAGDTGLRDLAQTSVGFGSRALGLTADRPPDPRLSEALYGRFALAFPNAMGRNASVTANAYDALYHLAYANAAAPRNERAPATDEIEVGLENVTLVGAERVDVGPGADGLDKGIAALLDHTPIELHGTSGAAAFDERRSRSGAVRAYCWRPDGQLGELASRALDGGGVELVGDEATACASEVFGAAAP